MALGDPYVTLEEAKTYARIDDSVDDAQILSVVKSASRQIERWCGRQFNDAGSATARVFDPEDRIWAFVDDFSTTTGLVIKTDSGEDGTYETTIASTGYTLYPLNGVQDGVSGYPYNQIRLNGGSTFPQCKNSPSLEVTARWGWASVPDAVKDATKIQMAKVFARRYSPQGQPLVGTGDFVFRISKFTDPDVVEMLTPYMRNKMTVIGF